MLSTFPRMKTAAAAFSFIALAPIAQASNPVLSVAGGEVLVNFSGYLDHHQGYLPIAAINYKPPFGTYDYSFASAANNPNPEAKVITSYGSTTLASYNYEFAVIAPGISSVPVNFIGLVSIAGQSLDLIQHSGATAHISIINYSNYSTISDWYICKGSGCTATPTDIPINSILNLTPGQAYGVSLGVGAGVTDDPSIKITSQANLYLSIPIEFSNSNPGVSLIFSDGANNTQPVPEPATSLLLALGIGALLLRPMGKQLRLLRTQHEQEA